jgi:tetratricopeptide (TPR) repeat protein
MKHFIFCLLVLFSIQLPAQVLQNLKKMAEDKAKQVTSKENLNKVGNAVMKDLDKARAEFDSTDFDYAILLSDNSGLFDVKEKGEASAKFGTWVNLGSSMYKKDELTDAENARFNLETGELAYASGKYNYAERKLSNAKEIYEQASLTDDIGYIKSIADLGLLYATMGRFTQAETFTQEALDLRKEKLGEFNIGVASSLNNYGVLRYNLAHYNEAEKD